MKDEIKEIIKLDCKEEIEVKYFAKDNRLVNTYMDYSQLLDYITNLQEENERLKKELLSKPDNEITLETADGQRMTIIQSERINMQEKLNKSLEKLYKKYNDYKTRNEKAIEYIKKRDFDEVTMDNGWEIDFDCKENLLNILQGSEDK